MQIVFAVLTVTSSALLGFCLAVHRPNDSTRPLVNMAVLTVVWFILMLIS